MHSVVRHVHQVIILSSIIVNRDAPNIYRALSYSSFFIFPTLGLDLDCPLSPSGRVQRCFQGAGCFNRMKTISWVGVVAIMFDADEHTNNHRVSTTTEEGEEEVSTALMGDVEKNALKQTLISTLQILLDDKLYLEDLNIRGQFYDRPCVEAVFPVFWERDDPSTMALDVTMRIIARFIPSTETAYNERELGEVFISGLQNAQDTTIRKLKNANSFFNAAKAVAAVAEEFLAESPSSMPSTSPTRDFDQLFETRVDPTPSGANGIIFSVKTPKGGPSILIDGMRFITNFDKLLEYEVYSKLGPWRNFVGKFNDFELIASGQVTGKGKNTWVDIIQDDHVGTIVNGNETTTTSVHYVGWKNIHVLGDGGERSFYLTTTKTFLQKDQSAIPILFSSAMDSSSESLRKYGIVKANAELELYEGDGVLDYPMPTDPNGQSPYFRRPRGPIIAISYDRSPCFPNANFTGWPCPYVQRTRNPTFRPTPNPTKRPTLYPTPRPTRTLKPSNLPTAAITSNVTETANLTVSDVQFGKNDAQVNTNNDTNDTSGSMNVSFSCWYCALLGSLLLQLSI